MSGAIKPLIVRPLDDAEKIFVKYQELFRSSIGMLQFLEDVKGVMFMI